MDRCTRDDMPDLAAFENEVTRRKAMGILVARYFGDEARVDLEGLAFAAERWVDEKRDDDHADAIKTIPPKRMMSLGSAWVYRRIGRMSKGGAFDLQIATIAAGPAGADGDLSPFPGDGVFTDGW